MSDNIFIKDMAEVLDYVYDFSSVLEPAENITNQILTEDSGNITIDADSITELNKSSTVVLSSGIKADRYIIACEITTDKQLSVTPLLFRIYKRRIIINVLDK